MGKVEKIKLRNFKSFKKVDLPIASGYTVIIGPNGDVARVSGGGSGYNGGHYAVSLLEGIKNKFGKSADVQFKRGIAIAKMELPIVTSSMLMLPKEMGDENGVWAEYFNNRDLEGEPDLKEMFYSMLKKRSSILA